MKKTDFYKTMYNGKNQTPKFEKTTGYMETLTDSAGNNVIICLEKTSSGFWNATEKTSGLLVKSGFRTRAAAMKELKENYLDAITAKLKDCKFVKLLHDFMMEDLNT